jgi:lipopolysaccharide transport system ATP-binding protein
MSVKAIVVENLSKRYLIGHRSAARRHKYTALRDVIAQEVRNFARKAGDVIRGRQVVQGDEIEEFWALKDVSFEIAQGAIVGIVGHNGAGKSTLLKILSRITEPTEGRIWLHGRVASLLEVGTGFHPELSGRENIYLNGAVLGMRQREIRQKFDEIVAFAEVEKFLDTPVKHYSSGMYVRLAFAVAAHLEPEILIVDEVLAVGDAAFQKKCLGKMEQVSRLAGRTVIVVSHNVGVLSSLCPRTIWLEQGSVFRFGRTSEIIGDYVTKGTPNLDRIVNLTTLRRRNASDDDDDRLRFESIEWLSELPLRHEEGFKVRINLRARTPVEDVSVVLGFSNLDGSRVLSYRSDYQSGLRAKLTEPGPYSVTMEVRSLPLSPGVNNLDLACYSGDSHHLDYIPGAVQLEIVPGPKTPGSLFQSFGGVRGFSHWAWDPW